MAKVKDEKPVEKPVAKRPEAKKVTVVSKGNFELTLDHSHVCRTDQRCYCKSVERNGKYMRIPASIHLVSGVETEVPACLLTEKGGFLPALEKAGKVVIVPSKKEKTK